MTLAEIKEQYPEELKRARADPYRHRYPRAEVNYTCNNIIMIIT